jgi:hypothetical protein
MADGFERLASVGSSNDAMRARRGRALRENDEARNPIGQDRLDPYPVAASDSASPSVDVNAANAPTADVPPMVTIPAIAVMPVGRVAILSKLGRPVL